MGDGRKPHGDTLQASSQGIPHRDCEGGVLGCGVLGPAGTVDHLSLESRRGYQGNLSVQSREAEERQKDRAWD